MSRIYFWTSKILDITQDIHDIELSESCYTPRESLNPNFGDKYIPEATRYIVQVIGKIFRNYYPQPPPYLDNNGVDCYTIPQPDKPYKALNCVSP